MGIVIFAAVYFSALGSTLAAIGRAQTRARRGSND
jgi:hypothetical protein